MQSPGFQSNVRNIGSPLLQQSSMQSPQFNSQTPEMGGQFGGYMQQLQMQIRDLQNQIHSMNQRQPTSQPAMQAAAKPGMQSNVQPEVQQKEEGSPDPYLPTKGRFVGTPFAKFSPRYYINKYGGIPKPAWNPETGKTFIALKTPDYTTSNGVVKRLPRQKLQPFPGR